MKISIRVALTAVVCLCFAAATAMGADLGSTNVAADTSAVSPPTTATPAPAPASVVAEPNYKIAADDVLRMDVWGEQQLSAMQMQVTPDGHISVPYLGDMKVVDLTQTQVAEMISKRLAEQDIVYDAKVQISLISMHKLLVQVLGAVMRPGSFEFKDGDTIMDAVAQGGSYSDDAMLESASLTHKGSDTAIPINMKKLFNGDLTQNYVLKNGDAVYIPHEDYNNKIYVLGQVNRPGQYSLKDRTTILAAISLAGGPTDRGAIRKTVVVRGDPAKPERVATNLDKLFDKGDLSQDLVLKSGDIVVVPQTKSVDWYKISSIVSAAVNVTYLHRLGW